MLLSTGQELSANMWLLLLTLGLLCLAYLYARLNLFFAHAEAAYDSKFIEAIERTQKENLNSYDAEFVRFLIETYTAQNIGRTINKILFARLAKDLKQALAGRKIVLDRHEESLNVMHACYYWAGSHVNRQFGTAFSYYTLMFAVLLVIAFLRPQQAADAVNKSATKEHVMEAAEQFMRGRAAA